MGLEKEVVILAKSRKYNNYCVAGIDKNNNKLIRLITNDKENHYAVSKENLAYENGESADIYDQIVVATTINDITMIHQPENVMMDTRYYIGKNTNWSKDRLRDIICSIANKYEEIFYNKANCISEDDFKRVCNENIHSLELVIPDIVTLRVKDPQNRTLRANIYYKGNWYNNLSITDSNFEKLYFERVLKSKSRYISILKPVLLISLGEKFNGDYYKLVASVLEI